MDGNYAMAPENFQQLYVIRAPSLLKQLVGHSHPSFYNVIDNIRKDEALVKTMMLQDDTGEPPYKKTKRNYVCLQKHLKSLCKDIVASRKSTKEFLRVVGRF